MAKAFSLEDGNLSNVSLTSSITKLNKDIDLAFLNRPSGDIYKKTGAAAVRQSIKNLLMTNHYEKPFEPFFGGNLNRFLFNLSEEFDEFDIEEAVTLAVNNYEPRARVLDVKTRLEPDNNSIKIEVVFQIISTSQTETVVVSLTRLR